MKPHSLGQSKRVVVKAHRTTKLTMSFEFPTRMSTVDTGFLLVLSDKHYSRGCIQHVWSFLFWAKRHAKKMHANIDCSPVFILSVYIISARPPPLPGLLAARLLPLRWTRFLPTSRPPRVRPPTHMCSPSLRLFVSSHSPPPLGPSCDCPPLCPQSACFSSSLKTLGILDKVAGA